MNRCVELIKKSEQPATPSAPPLTDFQIERARVETQSALKIIEFYARNVADRDYQSFLLKRWLKTSEVVSPSR